MSFWMWRAANRLIRLLIAQQLVRDVELVTDHVEVVTVPPLCPLAVSSYDFSSAHELIERRAEHACQWLAGGGLRSDRVPGGLRPHTC